MLRLRQREGAMVMIHAENDGCVRWLTDKLLDGGKTGMKFHGVARSRVGEREATYRAIAFSELLDVPILIAHVSARQAMDEIRSAQDRGAAHLRRDLPAISVPHRRPPGIRTIWRAPNSLHAAAAHQGRPGGIFGAGCGTAHFTVLSSDHSPWRFAEIKTAERGRARPSARSQRRARHRDATAAAVLRRRRQRAYNPQPVRRGERDQCREALRPYPRKGTIAIGSDADLAIWDQDREVRLTNDILHHNADYTPYEGMAARGLAGGHPVPRPTGVPRWRAVRRGGARRVPGLRAATCGTSATAKPDPGADTGRAAPGRQQWVKWAWPKSERRVLLSRWCGSACSSSATRRGLSAAGTSSRAEGPDYCQACRDDGLPCARGEPGADGRLCPVPRARLDQPAGA